MYKIKNKYVLNPNQYVVHLFSAVFIISSCVIHFRSLQKMSEPRAYKNPYPDYTGPGCAQDLFDMQGNVSDSKT